jgi:DNA-binding beta-propeller fold protein YncE
MLARMKTLLAAALVACMSTGLAAQGGPAGRGGAPRVVHVPDAPVLDYTEVAHPLALPDGRAFAVVASVAVAANGHVFVYQRAPQPLIEFDEHGRFVRDLREGTDVRAHSVRVDAAEDLWTVDAGAHTVTRLDPRGNVLMTLGTRGVEGSGPEAAKTPLFNTPADVAVAANGDIFVVQGENGAPDPRVIRFDRAGRFLTTWSLAYTEGRRSSPHAIAIDGDGLIYVADRDVMRVRIFRPDGTPVRDIQLENRVYGLALDRDGSLWIATGNDGMVQHVDTTGRVLGYMGKAGRGEGLIGEGHLLALAPNGDIYVADTINSTVHKFVRR